jgi:hypothetical protein
MRIRPFVGTVLRQPPLRNRQFICSHLCYPRHCRQQECCDALSLRDRVEKAVAVEDASSAPALIAAADTLVEGELTALAADARHRAVLKGLAGLGYEVNEGMATALVQGGHVVLRKAADPDYGVELGGGTKSDQLQVRADAFGGLHDLGERPEKHRLFSGGSELRSSLGELPLPHTSAAKERYVAI